MAKTSKNVGLYAPECPIYYSDGVESPIPTEAQVSFIRGSFEPREQ